MDTKIFLFYHSQVLRREIVVLWGLVEVSKYSTENIAPALAALVELPFEK